MNKREKNVDYVIRELLYDLKISRRYVGYPYIYDGIKFLLEDITLLNYISKGLYLEIGIKYHVTTKIVERDIRSIRERTWREFKNYHFFRGFEKIPSNGIFMDMLVYEVERRLQQAEEEELEEAEEALCV